MANSEAKKAANRKYAATVRKEKYIKIQITKDQHAALKERALEKNITIIQLINFFLSNTP